MRVLKKAWLVILLAALPLAAADQPTSLEQVVDRIANREAQVVSTVRQYSPMVETYIQLLRPDKELGAVPAGDRYFLGRADFSNSVEVRSMGEQSGEKRGWLHSITSFFNFVGMDYLPDGFLQMVFVDTNGFDRQHYKFEYVRREFLGEVRCLVFDVIPLPKSGKGRFIGRIWVEDQDYTIVRLNGAYTGSSVSKFYFHFDSWRVNAGPGLWLPAYVYSEETNYPYAIKRLQFKAQTRLWGYNLGQSSREQELSRILVEAPTPVTDQSEAARDLSPVQSQRAWDRQAEDNVIERLERSGLLAPRGDVDKVLETVVNNLEVTNNLEIQPEVRCRILLTSTLESFTVGHTIVLSRGLVDVLPDEASLATMVAHELGHAVLGHRMDTQFAFNDRLLFKDEETFRHFYFGRNPAEEEAANQKALELLSKSPYKDSLGNAGLFLQALELRARQIPNLISPHLGDRVPGNSALQANATAPESKDGKPATLLAALPLGSRIKMDPWSDRIELTKSKPAGYIAEREKMPFEVTPFMVYLTRQTPLQATPAVTAVSAPDSSKKPQ